MRVFLIGPTGILGSRAVPALLEAGHQVTGLARNHDRAAAIARLGIEPAIGDLFDPDSLAKILPTHEAVLNLATRIPTPTKLARPNAWAANDKVRTDGSASLLAAASACPDVHTIVQEGISFYYADGGDDEITEESPIDVPPPLRSSITAHENAARFATNGRAAVRLRIGFLTGSDPLTTAQLKLARFGVPLIYGSPDGWTAPIRPTDAATGAVAALTAPSGIYNVTAGPIRKRDFGTVLAAAAGVRRARALPPQLVKFLGPVSVFARSQRIIATKLTEATGWKPAEPTPTTNWLND